MLAVAPAASSAATCGAVGRSLPKLARLWQPPAPHVGQVHDAPALGERRVDGRLHFELPRLRRFEAYGRAAAGGAGGAGGGEPCGPPGCWGKTWVCCWAALGAADAPGPAGQRGVGAVQAGVAVGGRLPGSAASRQLCQAARHAHLGWTSSCSRLAGSRWSNAAFRELASSLDGRQAPAITFEGHPGSKRSPAEHLAGFPPPRGSRAAGCAAADPGSRCAIMGAPRAQPPPCSRPPQNRACLRRRSAPLFTH